MASKKVSIKQQGQSNDGSVTDSHGG